MFPVVFMIHAVVFALMNGSAFMNDIINEGTPAAIAKAEEEEQE
jgi:hypothetical protein